MDKRLKIIASHIENGVGFADVGTDHGYLPASMAASGYGGNIIATDINTQPLQTAVNTAELAGVRDRINFLLCDGLEKCRPELIDTIVIAGMGGDMICRILDYAPWCLDSKYKLLLQPMTKAEVVRYWLVYNGFEITCEELCEEKGSIYQIIEARFGGYTALSDAELFTGKFTLCRQPELFMKHTAILIDNFTSAVAGIEQSELQSKKIKLPLFKEILCGLRETEEKHGQAK